MIHENRCTGGHEFPYLDGIVDLLPNLSDKHLLEEAGHFDSAAKVGTMSIPHQAYFGKKMNIDYKRVIYEFLEKAMPDYRERASITIGEIGCGFGTAMLYLQQIPFKSVEYFGVDISMMMLQWALERMRKDRTRWRVHFARADAANKLFNNETIDIIFTSAALHHFKPRPVIKWVSAALKPGGLLLLKEPSIGNPIASLGRKIVNDINTSEERPLDPLQLETIADENGLKLLTQKGLHFLSAPGSILLGKLHTPDAVAWPLYYLSRGIDRLVKSPSRNYLFIQIYKKII
jgi:SAM-dependent methyltransferase